MVRKILKFIGIGLVAILLIAFIFYQYASWKVDNRLSKKYQIEAKDIDIPQMKKP